MTAEVLVVTNQGDLAVDHVIHLLTERGAQVQRLNSQDARLAPVTKWFPASSTPPGPRAVWWRQFEIAEPMASVEEADCELVTRAQWRTWLSTLDLPGSNWMNPLWSARRAENKLLQLETAIRTGLRVPETLVTNDPTAASEFVAAHGPAVIKSIASGYFSLRSQSFMFTESLDEAILQLPADIWHAQPVFVQRSITEAEWDCRVIAFGPHIFAARTRRLRLDWRLTDHAEWEVWSVPERLISHCRAYMSMLDLQYCAFDFLLSPDAVYFLEANQAGEWAFLDRALGMGIAPALADHLITLSGCKP